MLIISFKLFIECLLAIIALINPISKIVVVAALSEQFDRKALMGIVIKATVIAGIILVSFIFIGDILLKNIFHIQIYAFKIAGGLVLVLRGFEALNKGYFFELTKNTCEADVSIVPIASPMIAGPAAISASLSFPVKYGILVTNLALIAALLINLLIMLYALAIKKFLIKHHFMEALIRITGLIVATIGIQMISDGVFDFINLHNFSINS